MGASHRKLTPAPPLNYDNIISILRSSLSITVNAEFIDYLLILDRQYHLLNYIKVKRMCEQGRLDEIIKRASSLAFFRVSGNFRMSVWEKTRQYNAFLFVDLQQNLWMIDPVAGTIISLCLSFRIDKVASI